MSCRVWKWGRGTCVAAVRFCLLARRFPTHARCCNSAFTRCAATVGKVTRPHLTCWLQPQPTACCRPSKVVAKPRTAQPPPVCNPPPFPPASCRFLYGMPTDAGAAELQTWSTFQQLDVLAAMDAVTASRLLTLVPVEARKDLIQMMEPHVAANIVQVGGEGVCSRGPGEGGGRGCRMKSLWLSVVCA